MKARTVQLSIGICGLLIAVAACGSDSAKSAASTSGSAAGIATTAAASATTAASSMTTTAVEGIPLRGVTDSSIRVGAVAEVKNLPGYEDGIRARFERVNRDGGVQGRKIDWVGVRDDATDPSQNLNLARELVEKDKVFAVLTGSQVTLPQTTDYLASQQTPFLGWGFLPGYCVNPYGFGHSGCASGAGVVPNYPGDYSIPDGTAKIAGKPVSELTYAYAGNDSDIARQGALIQVANIQKRGGKVVYNKLAIPEGGTGDYTPFVQEIMTSNDGGAPDVVVSVTDFPNAVGLHAALNAAGFKGIDLSFVSYVPGLLEQQPNLADALEGAYIEIPFPAQEEESPATKQIEADLQAIGKPTFVTLGASQGWYTADMLVQMIDFALPSANGTMKGFVDKVNSGWKYQGLEGSIGPVSFPENHTSGVPCYGFMKVVGGKYQLALPFTCYDKPN